MNILINKGTIFFFKKNRCVFTKMKITVTGTGVHTVDRKETDYTQGWRRRLTDSTSDRKRQLARLEKFAALQSHAANFLPSKTSLCITYNFKARALFNHHHGGVSSSVSRRREV